MRAEETFEDAVTTDSNENTDRGLLLDAEIAAQRRRRLDELTAPPKKTRPAPPPTDQSYPLNMWDKRTKRRAA